MKISKQNVILAISIIASFLYIFAGNKYLDFTRDESLDEYDVYKAKIVEILEVHEEQYDLGGQISIGKTVHFNAKILNGDLKGEIVSTKQEISPFFSIQPIEVSVGNKIVITQSVENYGDDAGAWTMLEYLRTDGILILVILFFALLIWFGKSKGILTMVSLTLTCLSVFLVFIPAIMTGRNIYFWSVQVCVFIIVMTLLIVNGFNKKSLSAGIGCIGGVFVSALLVLIMDNVLKLTGMVDSDSIYLQMINPDSPINLKAIIFAAIIIGAVGAIMDVAISIASSLNEIYEQNTEIPFASLYKSGITIGRDIMGTMTNTLVLAYIGSSLSVVLLLLANTPSVFYLINTEMIVVELLQAIVGSIAILLTLPLTSVISATLYTKIKRG